MTWRHRNKSELTLNQKSTDGEKSKPGPKKKSKADFCDDKKKSLTESDKGSWRDQPKEETNDTQAGASRVKIAGLNGNDKFKVEPVPSVSENFSD